MKNFKKLFAVILVTIMAATILISCGGVKASPEESTKIYLDVILKDDKTNMDKIGATEEDYAKLKKTNEDEIMKGFENSGIDDSILTDEIKTNFKNNIFKGISSLSYEVTPVSEEKETAKVEVKIKVFDMEKISTDAQNIVLDKATTNPNITEKEIYTELFNFIGEAMAKGTVKQDSKTVPVTLTKKGNVWSPNDSDIDAIVTAIIGS